ncbi:MAG: hypothetical protein DMG05_22135 [Acidobacteria bacterium]|nr:MAG: hypothetical protein DMG05_22135 [Acidobacteriota bacterium]
MRKIHFSRDLWSPRPQYALSIRHIYKVNFPRKREAIGLDVVGDVYRCRLLVELVVMALIVQQTEAKEVRTMKKICSTLTVLSIFFLFTGLIVAQQTDRQQQAAPAQAQEKLQAFEGELAKVDATAKRLWVKGSDGKEMEFGYNEQTQIIGAGGSVEGLATMSGTRVKVHYDEASKIASAIEVQSKPEK